MNRHCYRVLFNRVRGLFVVCQENARSAGGSPSPLASAVRFAAVAVIAAACALLCVDLAHGQIIADPSAPGSQRPTVLSAPNGVPVVNIQTPSAAGVSHNTYRQFDVATPGAILNNSRGNVQTQLGGWVQGNPWLAQGGARVILNEVNAGNPSLLRGAVEVAGPRAEVIIANPSGITVNGGSFINTSRVTLTTGTPVMNGGNLESYRVQRGSVLFEGRGLDASATDYTTVLARAVQVNAGIWARELKVVAGAHEASADGSVTTPIAGTGPAPAYLLDVAALGGMYAGHIFLVGTEAGLGVRNAGNIASTGTLTLTADGKLINSGSLLAQTDLSLQAGAIDNRGSVEAGGSARLASLNGDIGNVGGTITARRLELQSVADIDNRGGTLRQTGAGVLQVAAAVLDNSAGGTVGNRPAAESGSGTTSPTNPTVPPVDPVTPTTTAPTRPTTPTTPTAPNTPDLTPGTVRAQGVLRNTEGKLAGNAGITLAAGRIDNSGGFVAVDRVTGPVVLSNAGGDFRVTGDLSLAGAVLDNRAGKLLTGGALLASVGRVDNTGGVVQASTLALNVDRDIDNSAGTLRATAATAAGIDIRAGGALHNGAGQIESAAGATLAAGGIDGDAGRVVALGNLDIRSAGDTLARQSIWTAGGTLKAAAGGTLDTRGAGLDATQALHIDAQALDNRGGRIVGGSDVAVATTAGLLNDDGLVHAASELQVNVGGALSNRAGSLESAGKTATLAIRAADIDNSGGRIVNAGSGATTVTSAGVLNLGASGAVTTLLGGNGSVDITAGSLQVAAGSTIAASGALSLAVDGAAVNAGSISGAGNLRLNAATLDNRSGRIEAADTLAVTSGGALDNRTGTLRAGRALALNAGGDITNDRGAIEAVASDAALSIRSGTTLDNGAGRIANAGTGAATIAADRIVNAATGSLLANGALRLQSATLDNQAGASIGAASLGLDVRDTAVNRGAIASNGTLAFVQTGATLDNRAGRITAAGAIDLQLQNLLNTGGTVSSDGELRVALASDFTNDGLLHAGGDMGLNVAGALVNTATLEAVGTLRTDSASLTNTGRAVIQAGKVDLNTPGALVNAGEISGTTVVAHADSISNTGGITGADVELNARTLTNTGSAALIGATRGVKLNGSESVTNSDGATVYSVGDIGIQTTALVNRSATIEAGKDIAITASSVLNERPLLELGQTVALTENHTLTMPGWWHNNAQHQNNYAGSVNGTNLTAYQVYYLDPADILESGSFVTPDGFVIGRAVVRTHADDTSYFSGRAGWNGAYGHRERAALTDGTRVIYYTLRTDGAANPDQVAGAAATSQWPGQDAIVSWDTAVPVNSAYGRCTTRCVVLTQPWQYTDPGTTIIRDTQNVGGPSTALMELRRDVTTTATDDTVRLGVAARIAAGGNIRIAYADSMTNRFGDVIAGGTLNIDAVRPAAGAVDNQAVTLYRRYRFGGTYTLADGSVNAWHQPDISQAIGTARGVLSGALGVTITGQTLRNIDLSAGNAANIVDAVHLTSGGQPAPAAATGSAAAAAQLGSTRAAAGGFIASPGALYNARPQPDVPYLYETRPAFANYRDWLSSDYLLNALGIDPAATQKRLGDGFYEQQLVIQQIEKLTGRRYLAGQANDLEQYRALLESGVTYARQYGLVPGISLSAAQMAALTSDIVWLQSETVTLADGSTQQVLVPHVYLARLGEGVLAPDGALITGSSLDITAGSIVNRGGVLGGAGTRKAVLVASADVLNQGGLISAGDLDIKADGDIKNESLAVQQTWTGPGTNQSATSASNLARIVAGEKLVITAKKDVVDTGGQVRSGRDASIEAGRDLIFKTLQTGSSETLHVGSVTASRSSRQNQGSALTVDGNLDMTAGRDIALTATHIQAGGDAKLIAGRNVSVGAAQDTASLERRSDDSASPDFLQSRDTSTSQGSSIRAGGDLGIRAGTGRPGDIKGKPGDITVTGSTLDAKGAAVLIASRDVNIVEARDTASSRDENRSSSSGLLSSTSRHTDSTSSSDTTAGSSVGGRTVTISAGNDANVRGSNVVADQTTAILAGHDINITAAQDTRTSGSVDEKTRSGLMGSGGVGFTVGSRAQTSDRTNTTNTVTGSTVGSIGGDVTLVAGNRYTQTGSDVAAPAGDITIQARDVRITEARETSTTTSAETFRQSGISVAVTSAALAAAQSTGATVKAVGNTGDGRMQALGAASAAMNAASAVKAADALLKDPGSAVNVSVSLGRTSSSSTSTQTSDTARASTLGAGRDIRIVATGAGKASDILIQGGQVQAGRDVVLDAEGDVLLRAAKNTQEQHSTSKSNSASIGGSLGAQTGVTFSANAARGNADGSDVSHTNTHVEGGQSVTVRSGGDTTLQGAVVKGRQVVTDTQGSLLIESLQDTSSFDSRNKNASASLAIGPTGPTGGSASFGKSQAHADYASVVEQSGIQAGDGGFQVRTQGNTGLVGGVIASTQRAVDDGRNSFDTASLTIKDIQNQEDYKAGGLSIGGGYTAAGTGKPSDGSKADGVTGQGAVPNTTGGMNTPAVGFGSASGHQGSTTSSGISGVAGNKEVRSGDSSGGLTKTFDADKVTKEVAAQVQITSTFNQQAASAIGDYADKQRIAAIALRTQADQEPDPAKQAQLRESAQTLENNWGPNGTLRIAAQGVVAGLTGGLPGALGAASGAVAAPAIADALAAAHIECPLASALTAAASAAIGGLVGGSVGASTSVNEVVNNYLQHSTHWRSSQWGAFKEELARCQATSGCNVDGVYQRWTAIGNDQQKAAMSSMDAMLGADPSAAAEAGKSFGAAAAAMSVSPADVCPPGDARCAGFVGQQNNQAAAILRTGLVVAYANDLVDGGRRANTELKNNNAVEVKSGTNGEAPRNNASSQNIATIKRLAQELQLESANSPFFPTGRMTNAAINDAKPVPGLGPGELSNPAIPFGFGKYTTDTFQSPAGNFQVHFYKNPNTGEVLYDLDYKVIFNNMSGAGKK